MPSPAERGSILAFDQQTVMHPDESPSKGSRRHQEYTNKADAAKTEYDDAIRVGSGIEEARQKYQLWARLVVETASDQPGAWLLWHKSNYPFE